MQIKLSKKYRSLDFLLTFIAAIWIVHAVTLIIPLQQYGLRPRTVSGLVGILTAPFLHSGFPHLFANTLGLLTFGGIYALFERKKASFLIWEIIFFQGALLWLFGRSCNHIGASGLIFGLFGYLLLAGWFQKKITSLIVSLIVLFLYGGTLFGVLPSQPGISWEGHLFGFIVGCVEAKIKA
jgi:membrane associated rhomboid family serine protease